MVQWLFVLQIIFAITAGVLVFAVLRSLSQRVSGAALSESKKRISNWPSPARHLWVFFTPLIPIAERWSRPSVRLSRALAAVYGHGQLRAQEFGVFRGVVTLFTILAGLIAVLIHAVYMGSLEISVVFLAFCAGGVCYGVVTAQVFDQYKILLRQISRSFPNFLDVLGLTLESGKNFQSALQLSAQQLPGQGAAAGLRKQLDDLIQDMHVTGSRTTALQRFSERLGAPEIVQFTAAVIAADRQGVSVSGLLRRQAEQLRMSHALAAERHAMKLPVKLLAPLAICIFPCTFLILAFPLVVRLSGSGLF